VWRRFAEIVPGQCHCFPLEAAIDERIVWLEVWT
jgi:hypothetical protein